jgi:hypothetical protein
VVSRVLVGPFDPFALVPYCSAVQVDRLSALQQPDESTNWTENKLARVKASLGLSSLSADFRLAT